MVSTPTVDVRGISQESSGLRFSCTRSMDIRFYSLLLSLGNECCISRSARGLVSKLELFGTPEYKKEPVKKLSSNSDLYI